MSDQIAALKSAVRKDRIATLRYLAFLEAEMSFLLHELYPGQKRGERMVWFPVDRQVNSLRDASPLSRAAPMLRAAGIDPYEDDDAWIEFIDADMSKLQEIRPKGKGEPPSPSPK